VDILDYTLSEFIGAIIGGRGLKLKLSTVLKAQ